MTGKAGKKPEGHKLGTGDLIVPRDAQSRAFVRELVERGEAVHPPTDGKLPPGATYVIVGTTSDGWPILQHARVSLF